MYEDWNKDSENDQNTDQVNDNQTNSDNTDNTQKTDYTQGEYRYSKSDLNQPKWEPDTEKYNTYYKEETVRKPAKARKRWWIPLAAVLAVMVVAVIVAGVVALNTMRKSIDEGRANTSISSNNDTNSSIILGDNTQITDSSIDTVNTSTVSGIVLTDVSDIVEEVMPSVVSITARSLVSNANSYWGYYFGNGHGNTTQEEVESGIGSGTIVAQNDTELMILTSYHVVEGSSSLYVTFNDGAAVDGYIKASAEDSDIAIVAVPLTSISDETMAAIKIATLSTAEVSVGEGIIVIGDALGYGQSVVTGIISAKDTTITVEGKTITALQTDAAINSGNSGGCMLDKYGNVVGISEAKIQNTAVEGMCYAIPIYNYYDLIMQLINTETESDSTDNGSDTAVTGTAYIGIYGVDITTDLAGQYNLPVSEGVYVANVINGGGAQTAGIVTGDIIVAADGEAITALSQLQEVVQAHSPGDVITLSVYKYSASGYVLTTIEVTLTAQIS